MTSAQLLEAVNAAGITPEELTATLKGGAISVRNTTLGLKIQALEKLSREKQDEINAQVNAIRSEMLALQAQQVAAAAEVV